MKYLVYIIFTTFFFLFSCAKQRPKGVLSESDAVDLFTEVALVDAYLQSLPLDSGRRVLPVLYDNLFNQFGIDSNQFKLNVDYYYGNPLLTEKIYSTVSQNLLEKEKIFRSEDSVRNIQLQDSIRYISRLQKLHSDRVNNILNHVKDTTSYTFKLNGLAWFDRMDLNIQAYGIQIPAIPNLSTVPNEVPATSSKENIILEQEAIPDTIIKNPVRTKILRRPNGTSAIKQL